MDVCLLLVLLLSVEVSVSGSSLVQRSPTEGGVSECDNESSKMKRSWTNGGLLRHGKTVVDIHTEL